MKIVRSSAQTAAYHLTSQQKTKNFSHKKAILNQEDALDVVQLEKLTHKEAAAVAVATAAADVAVAEAALTDLSTKLLAALAV